MKISDESIIMRPVGKAVQFKYPEGRRRHGTLQSREIAASSRDATGVLYWTVVDGIAFDGDPERWLRVGYYRKPAGAPKPRWASQTTICVRLSKWRDGILPKIARVIDDKRAV
jgi:hypothetical protein